MKKQTQDKKKAEEKSAPIEEGQLHIQVDPIEVASAAIEENMIN